ncbi:MAG: acetoin dehydrogenase dihydrolipoyllysine-residue acetyltransferase subunit [Pseudomonadota bacterium]
MTIEPIKMPKWGLSMEEGKIVEWWAKEGDQIQEGDDLVDIETTKITNVCEAHMDGLLRKIIATPDETLPVGALIAVMADPEVGDDEIDAYVEQYQANFDVADIEEVAGGPDIRTVEVYGRSLRVGVMGEEKEGLPLVLLHGFGGDLDNWLLVQPEIAEDRPVYAIELPGHGESSKDVGDGTLSSLAIGIIAAIDSLDLKDVYLAGHSLGGAIAIEVSLRLGERVKSLALVCPACVPGGQLNEEYLDAFVSAKRARDLRGPAAQLFADPKFVTKDLLEGLVKSKRLDGALAALTLIKDKLKGGDPNYAALGDRINELVPPVTVIASKQDKIVGAPDESQFPAEAQFVWVEGAGHMPHLERSADVVAALRSLNSKS